jgi:hypothetical protein
VGKQLWPDFSTIFDIIEQLIASNDQKNLPQNGFRSLATTIILGQPLGLLYLARLQN